MLVGFFLFCVFCVAKIYFKKLILSRVCYDSLIYCITDVYSLQQPYQELFFTKFSINLFTIFTYFHLCATILPVRTSCYSWSSVKISSYSWSSVRTFSSWQEFLLIHDHLWESFIFCKNLLLVMIVCENLFFFVRIFLNPSYLWESLHINDRLLEFCSPFFPFYSFYETKQAYEYHHLKQIFYHKNMFCLLHMFQIYIFYFEFFWFCVQILLY